MVDLVGSVDEGWWWRLGIRGLLAWFEERGIKEDQKDIFTPFLMVISNKGNF